MIFARHNSPIIGKRRNRVIKTLKNMRTEKDCKKKKFAKKGKFCIFCDLPNNREKHRNNLLQQQIVVIQYKSKLRKSKKNELFSSVCPLTCCELHYFSGYFFPSLVSVSSLFFLLPCTLITERRVSATDGSSTLDLFAQCVYQVSTE